MQRSTPQSAQDALVLARFRDRPNRFLVKAELEDGGAVDAFLPNPGRMWELIFRDVRLWLRPAAPGRKTAYTVVAVERDGEPVYLDTHGTNRVAEHLIGEGRIAPLRGWRVEAAEVKSGRSRFDFLLRRGDEQLWLEVKSCTLYGNGVAMFPDAVTERGRRHVLELAAMAREGVQAAVLFVVHTQQVQWFMPDYHTDLAFSRALAEAARHLPIHAVSVGRTQELELRPDVQLLDIPWPHIRREAVDAGAYLLLMRLEREQSVEVGRLGAIEFPAGWHVYVGSALKGLDARLARHMRLRKRMHWHVDYLRQAASKAIPVPVRGSASRECALAGALAGVLQPGPAGFGSSDCACRSHLFYSVGNPLRMPLFHHVLQQFRMRPPEAGTCD